MLKVETGARRQQGWFAVGLDNWLGDCSIYLVEKFIKRGVFPSRMCNATQRKDKPEEMAEKDINYPFNQQTILNIYKYTGLKPMNIRI